MAAGAAGWACAQDILLRALRSAPRRYRLPPLPADAAAAAAAGTDVALAFAIEARRRAHARGAVPEPHVRELFTRSLAQAIAQALDPAAGDAGFQASVLQADDEQVAEYVRLAAQSAADERAVRLAIAAVAHPGKLRAMAAGRVRDELTRLHRVAEERSWSELHRALQAWLVRGEPDETRERLGAVLAGPALARLERADRLRDSPGVRRWLALCERRGPSAGSVAATAQGRASASAGAEAEAATAHAFGAIAALLERAAGEGTCRVVRGLRTPTAWPGRAANAKQEWDAALLHCRPAGAAYEIELLAEVKASPAAAGSDWPRLQRGLQRLARADAHESHRFVAHEGEVILAGASLRRLHPEGGVLPPHVVYCCSAPPDRTGAALGAAAQGMLLAEGASIAFAQRLARGERPNADELDPMWDALTSPRLHGVLQQWPIALAAREAMLQPQDLLDAVRRETGVKPA